MRKVILTAAICGETTKEQSPYVPYTPKEIAESAIEAGRAGASVAHLHARDEQGQTTFAASVYSDIVERIRSKSDIVINCTTGGDTFKEKIDVLSINPEIATLNCGSANLLKKVMINTPEELERTAREMRDRGIKPEIMIHSQGFVKNARELISRGLIGSPPLFNLFFASGGMDMNARNLVYLVDSLPEDSEWTATGSGDDAIPAALLALVTGGHARIGLEDCVYLGKGELAESNAQLIGKVVRLAEELNFEIASPDEAREILGII
jgi:3-keto-5-aminohexanoate cleavage enzyme